jgi:hypothetical protein
VREKISNLQWRAAGTWDRLEAFPATAIKKEPQAMWYYMKDGSQIGPVEDDEMKSLAAQGGLASSDLVWREGMVAWQPASAVPELGGSISAPALMAPDPDSITSAPPAFAHSQFSAAPGGPQGLVLPDYLPWAIAVTLLCCPPTGIASIIFANRANAAKAQGDWVTAEISTQQAKTWLIVSVVTNLAAIGLAVIMVIVGAMSGH